MQYFIIKKRKKEKIFYSKFNRNTLKPEMNVIVKLILHQ